MESALLITLGDNVGVGGWAMACRGVTTGDDTQVSRVLPATVLAVGIPVPVIEVLSPPMIKSEH